MKHCTLLTVFVYGMKNNKYIFIKLQRTLIIISNTLYTQTQRHKITLCSYINYRLKLANLILDVNNATLSPISNAVDQKEESMVSKFMYSNKSSNNTYKYCVI